MTFLRIRVKDDFLKQRLRRLQQFRFREAREGVADTLVKETPRDIEQQIKKGKLDLAPPKPSIIAKKTRSGAAKPYIPLYDTGGYAESWKASKIVRGTNVSLEVTPAGANVRGIAYRTIAIILHYGFTGQIPRPHINLLRDKIVEKGKKLLRAEVRRVLRNP